MVTTMAAVVGVVARPPRVFTSTDGATHLEVLMHQPDQGFPPFLVRQVFPAQDMSNIVGQVVRAKAARLHAGEEALCIGCGLRPGTHEGVAVLKFHQVRDIVPLCAVLQDHRPEGANHAD